MNGNKSGKSRNYSKKIRSRDILKIKLGGVMQIVSYEGRDTFEVRYLQEGSSTSSCRTFITQPSTYVLCAGSKMSLIKCWQLILIVANTMLVGVSAQETPSADPTTRKIHEGVNAPAKEISPGMYSHEFEHVGEDGTRTYLSYVARKVNHLVHLDDAKVGLISVMCDHGSIVEVTVKNESAPPAWTTASAEVNATILVGTDKITCDIGSENRDSQILHRVVERPVFDKSRNASAGHYVYQLLAEPIHFSHAFEHLDLKYYRGRRDASAAKADLHRASRSEKKNWGDSGGLDSDVPSKSSTARHVNPTSYLGEEEFSSGVHQMRRLLYSGACHPKCETCDGAGSDDCTSCDAYSSYPHYESGYWSGGYCHECTQNSHCNSYLCESNSCVSCNFKCGTCDGAGSDDCTSCDAYSSYPHYESGYWSGGYCHECTQNSHCNSNLCESNSCVSCNFKCGTCDGAGSDDCTSCDAYSSYPHYESGYWSGGYCHECTQDSHCGSGQVCTDYQCVAGPTCHASCKTCSGTGSDYCESCDSTGAYPYHRSGLISGGWCEECIQDSHCGSGQVCTDYQCVERATHRAKHAVVLVQTTVNHATHIPIPSVGLISGGWCEDAFRTPLWLRSGVHGLSVCRTCHAKAVVLVQTTVNHATQLEHPIPSVRLDFRGWCEVNSQWLSQVCTDYQCVAGPTCQVVLVQTTVNHAEVRLDFRGLVRRVHSGLPLWLRSGVHGLSVCRRAHVPRIVQNMQWYWFRLL